MPQQVAIVELPRWLQARSQSPCIVRGQDNPQSESAGTLVARIVSLGAPARPNRKQVRTFAELDFVARHENLVLTGLAGVRAANAGLHSLEKN